MDDPAQPMLENSLLGGDQEVPDSQAAAGDNFMGDNLVDAPKMVDKAALQIG